MNAKDDPLVIGSFVAGHESGSQGTRCIAYDPPGGTSYGTYQLSSRMGSLKSFVLFCKDKALKVYDTLFPIIGKANTGSKKGTFPDKWLALCDSHDLNFDLEYTFYVQYFYKVALNNLKSVNGLAWYMVTQNRALQEVLWSTAVQHGMNKSGAPDVFSDAYEAMRETGNISSDDFIKAIYADRANMGKRFPSLLRSNPKMAETIRTKRFPEECKQMIALNAKMYDPVTV